MIISRGSTLLRTLLKTHKNKLSPTISRNSHAWYYREPPAPPPKRSIIIAELAGGFMWWWILWHLWHEYQHITGEFDYPDVTKWTNEELGIPDDDDEDLGLLLQEE